MLGILFKALAQYSNLNTLQIQRDQGVPHPANYAQKTQELVTGERPNVHGAVSKVHIAHGIVLPMFTFGKCCDAAMAAG